MVNGNMCCGISDKALMIRVGAASREQALAQPHTRPMTMRGKSLALLYWLIQTDIAPKRPWQNGSNAASISFRLCRQRSVQLGRLDREGDLK